MVPGPRNEPRSAVLVIRAWTEPDAPGGVRARLLSSCGQATPEVPWATVAGAEDVCEEVKRWLAAFAAAPPDAPPPADAEPPGGRQLE